MHLRPDPIDKVALLSFPPLPFFLFLPRSARTAPRTTPAAGSGCPSGRRAGTPATRSTSAGWSETPPRSTGCPPEAGSRDGESFSDDMVGGAGVYQVFISPQFHPERMGLWPEGQEVGPDWEAAQADPRAQLGAGVRVWLGHQLGLRPVQQ